MRYRLRLSGELKTWLVVLTLTRTHGVPTHMVPVRVHGFVPVTNLSAGSTLSACPSSTRYAIGPTANRLNASSSPSSHSQRLYQHQLTCLNARYVTRISRSASRLNASPSASSQSPSSTRGTQSHPQPSTSALSMPGTPFLCPS